MRSNLRAFSGGVNAGAGPGATVGIGGILFDKDGTLFGFEATWCPWAVRTLTDLAGGDPALAGRLGRAIGFDLGRRRFAPDSPVIAGTPAQLAALLAPLLPGLTELEDRLNRQAAAAPQVPAVPLHPLLDALRGRGLKLGVATNDAEAPAWAHLRAAGVSGHFDCVIGSDSGFGAKPQPGPLLAFCTATGIAPARIAMVGDSAHDLAAARAAGMIAVAVLTGPAPRSVLERDAHVVLDDISALPAWLDRSPG
ncbi:MAG: HAD family hydrolase [Tranquillimonas sp.]